jgi:nucleoside-diphosphate-sugar epimerase
MLLGKQVRPMYTDARAGDVKHSLADISLAREVIGYEPVVRFEDGLRRAIDWYRNNL